MGASSGSSRPGSYAASREVVMKPIRIGTRSSMLAIAQAAIVSEALCSADSSVRTELVRIRTRGDKSGARTAEIGGKGTFTAELETALRDKRIDLAVHSAKDVPLQIPEDLQIAAVPERIDPADALVTRTGGPLESLASGATVATGSLRRRAQLLEMRPDLRVVDIRGNVETRLRKVLDDGGRVRDEDRIDATVLAMAGLIRSGLLNNHLRCVHPFDVQRFIPAAGQGALIVQTRTGTVLADLLSSIDDEVSSQAVLAERSVLRELNADCHDPVAVYIYPSSEKWAGLAMRTESDSGKIARAQGSGETAAGVSALLSRQLARPAREENCVD